MAIWHEVHCDILSDGCDSHGGDNPHGWTLSAARRQAKALGFQRVGGKDVCKRCAATPTSNIKDNPDDQ